ncbi:MAG: phasin family protein [Chloroflexi bacterium]|nr:phasin family protein [Chloroflexota bacterium]
MTEKSNEPIAGDAPAADEAQHRPLYEAARRVLLAGIGAVALAQDEAEDFVDRLVERGELAEQEARKLVREMAQKRRKGVGAVLDKRLEELLGRMDIPTGEDLRALSQKIAALADRVEELKKASG